MIPARELGPQVEGLCPTKGALLSNTWYAIPVRRSVQAKHLDGFGCQDKIVGWLIGTFAWSDTLSLAVHNYHLSPFLREPNLNVVARPVKHSVFISFTRHILHRQVM